MACDFLPTLNRVKRITRNIYIFYESQEFPPFFDQQNLTPLFRWSQNTVFKYDILVQVSVFVVCLLQSVTEA